MVTDPTPFLSTIAGTSSGLVAIVGGLLVARFVSLDSEQQGAQRVLDDRSVMEAILGGVTDMTELRRQGDHQTRLTDEQLAPFVEGVRGELARAHQILEGVVPDSRDVEDAGWDAFRRSMPSLPRTDWELAWEVVFDQLCDRRAVEREAAEWARAAERTREAERLRAVGFPAFPAFAGLPVLSVPRIPALSPRLLAGMSNTDWRAIRARRRDELVASHERGQQQVEDLEGEVRRLRQARDAIVRPQGLGWGLGILGYFAVVGVVVPILLMSRGPKDLTALMGTLVVAGFCSGLVALLGYMAILALRLSRRRSATAKHERG